MEKTRTITVEGKEYPIYEIEKGGELLSIASYDLDDALLKALKNTTNKEERDRLLDIDDEIYCYMSPSVLERDEDAVIKYFHEYYD